MKIPNNPFILSGYHSPEYFCNREQELAQLKDHMINERNVVLYSWRRLGKSALIKRFLQEEERQGKIKAIYIDLMASRNMEKAIEILIEGVYQTFGKTKSGLSNTFQKLIGALGLSMKFDPSSGQPTFSLSLHSPNAENDNLKSIGKFLSEQKETVVIAIDEFQQISRYKEQDAEAVFRQFMQEFPSIRFIYSGSHRQMMQSMFNDSNRPFYRSCQLISLEPIPLEAYAPFIKHHFNLSNRQLTNDIIEKIYGWSRGQTYCIQLICNRFHGSNLKVNQVSLNQVQSEILEQEAPVFSNYFHLLSKAQWNTLIAIAKEKVVKNPLSQDFLTPHNLGPASTVSSALKALVEKELVIKEKDSYLLHDVLFSRWLENL